ncbi:hypothetical protein LZC95_50435 [Pendulispora brunnea]|uniref:Uncharacterized protein n=1 Tax=Pendulispora brunnea TaxID=2905690 RepID=A0ABZ2KC09_9BACT
MKIDGLVDEIAERIAERVVARIGNTAKTVYTTSKRGPHAPGKSRGWLQRHIKTMPGARQAGRDWVIDSADYDRWCTSRYTKSLPPAPRIAIRSESVGSTSEDELQKLADECLAEAGFRPTRAFATTSTATQAETTISKRHAPYEAALANVRKLDTKVDEAARRLGEAIARRNEALAALVELKKSNIGAM